MFSSIAALIGFVAVVLLFIALPLALASLAQPISPDRKPWLSFLSRDRLQSTLRFAGRHYPVSRRDYQVRQWLEGLVAERQAAAITAQTPVRLVSLLPELRSIINCRPVGGLVACLTAFDGELRALAAILLGRCGGAGADHALAVVAADRSPKLRRHTALALRRQAAHASLRKLQRDPDPRVRRIARQPVEAPRPYTDRLAQFTGHVASEQPVLPLGSSGRMPLFLLRPAGLARPPKRPDYVRRLLIHIRQLVRGDPEQKPAV
jgi:hypothetical protein